MSVLVRPPAACYDDRWWPGSGKPKQELKRFLSDATAEFQDPLDTIADAISAFALEPEACSTLPSLHD